MREISSRFLLEDFANIPIKIKIITAQLFVAVVLMLEKNVVKHGKDKQGQVKLWEFC